jgi:Ca2+-transporting ATPase
MQMQTLRVPTNRNSVNPDNQLIHRIKQVHQCGDRFRFEIRGLKDDQNTTIKLQRALKNEAWITNIQASHITGRVLVEIDSQFETDDLANAFGLLVEDFFWRKDRDLLDRELDLPTDSEVFASKLPSLTSWHSITLSKCLEILDTNPDLGISKSERQIRQSLVGKNDFNLVVRINHWQLIRDQLVNVPNGLLVGSAVISVLTGGLADAGMIAAVISINCIIGYRTSLSAEVAINSLGPPPTDEVRVLQNEVWLAISPENLVPGDIVQLKNGVVPADCLLLTSGDLTVDESMLTGESQNSPKQTGLLPAATPLHDRQNMLYAGTVITGGQGVGVVVGTGPQTEIGKIRSLTARTIPRKPQLQRQLDDLGTNTAQMASGLCGVFFIVGIVRGISILEMLKSAVSLAVAAIPEGLTAVGTLSFAFGIEKLKQRGVYCRDLRSVENIGSIHYLCLDKTGTVTANRMTAMAFYAGATPLTKSDIANGVTDLPHVMALLEVAALCSDAKIGEAGRSGSPTEMALLEAAALGKIDIASMGSRHPRFATVYRTNERLYMTTQHECMEAGDSSNSGVFSATKGDPEAVLKFCSAIQMQDGIRPLTDEDREAVLNENKRLAASGMRVLGFARTVTRPQVAIESDAIANLQYVWNGLIGISDPPRPGVANLIRNLHLAGIDTALITGDQLGTAISVAQELGFNGEVGIKAVDAKMLAGCSAHERLNIIAANHVFARVTPEEKLQIISALQDLGNIVGMTGDGVNDSPALRAADVGIAMGRSGSNAARETADLVISDDNLETLLQAILEGRTIRKNLKQTVRFMLASNYSEILSMLIGLILTGRNVLNPLQLLWVNIITDIFPGLALASKPMSPDIIHEAPPRPGSDLLSEADTNAMLRDSLVMTLGTLPHFIGKNRNSKVDSTGVLMSLVSAQMSYALALGMSKSVSDENSAHDSRLGMTVAASMVVQLGVPFTPFGRIMGMGRPNFGSVLSDIVVGITPAMIAFFGRREQGIISKEL